MLAIVSESAAEPISLSDAKYHLRMDDIDDSDILIQGLVSAARRMCEELTSTDLISRTYDYSIMQFPDDFLYLPRGPIQSITSITYTDAEGAEQTVSSDVYGLDKSDLESFLFLNYGKTWPSSRYSHNSITVRFVAGFTEVPQPIGHAIKMMVSELYDNRSISVSSGAVPKELPIAAQYLLAPYRRRIA